jgi:small-conductance mechanosensitive channel
VFRVSGLSRLAVTVLGGTGLLGLVIGFAFRNIAENFLASILISMQHPFALGDLIEVTGHKGFVQSVTMRSTLLMTLDGNHVQIPNATIYKETITNFTANPNSRFDFTVGIGYDDVIADAQTIALSVLREHPAVLDEPEPWALVESLGPATVNLRVYFWVDVVQHNFLKVRSAVIRLTKRAFVEQGISMPDESREVVFPKGVPVRMLPVDPTAAPSTAAPLPSKKPAIEPADRATEGNLASEAVEIQEQAEKSRLPEEGENLLKS